MQVDLSQVKLLSLMGVGARGLSGWRRALSYVVHFSLNRYYLNLGWGNLPLERRAFLTFFSVGTGAALLGKTIYRGNAVDGTVDFEDMNASLREISESIKVMKSKAPSAPEFLEAFTSIGAVKESEREIILADSVGPSLHSYIAKMRNYESSHERDLYLSEDKHSVLFSTYKRIGRVQTLIGHGNFNVLGFDEMLKIGRRYSSVGTFTSLETDFIEGLFSANAKKYGFLGDKVTEKLTSTIKKSETKKIAQTGHFLFRGRSEKLYQKLKNDIGGSITLTSGIRSIVKQTHLFIAKTIQSEGNLSKASRSLAPPGHSYHGIGDFDVGKVGYGSKNFTEAFSSTDEFKKLVDLGYVSIRYPRNNMLGVRYEPWHVKVV